jgi:quinol-cytochrome oxidoreductase complex cytochrome b subunit
MAIANAVLLLALGLFGAATVTLVYKARYRLFEMAWAAAAGIAAAIAVEIARRHGVIDFVAKTLDSWLQAGV